MKRKLTILTASAHPDDVEVFCAGTLIRYVKEGHKVFIAIACTGNVGSKIHTGPEIEAICSIEAQKAADVIGAELIMMGHKDSDVWRQFHLEGICRSNSPNQSGCDHYIGER